MYCLFDRSLCMLRGVSPVLEMELCRKGFISPEQVVANAEYLFSKQTAENVKKSYNRLVKCKNAGILDGLINAFPIGHKCRVIYDYFDLAAFVDVETDGLKNGSSITCLSVYHKKNMYTFVKGINLDDFIDFMKTIKLFVTFNGKRFDMPKIMKEYGWSCTIPQVDLMYEAAVYGLKNGLKNIEKIIKCPIIRMNECCTGQQAVAMWKKYLMDRNEAFLENLKKYNQDDVMVLVYLYKYILNCSLANIPIKLN